MSADNQTFLAVLKNSFKEYLKTNPRSNEKLKILHPFIASDICSRLGSSIYKCFSLGLGKEESITGRYMGKKVDITIKNGETFVAGIAVKFVMSNYSQNTNNYFENMLGETANIRCNGIPYFQIFCIFDVLPYFDINGNIRRWEHVSEQSISKYVKLSQDNSDVYFHTPNKTLMYILHLNPDGETIGSITTNLKYQQYYLKNEFSLKPSTMSFNFERSIIYNDYELFADKVMHIIKSI